MAAGGRSRTLDAGATVLNAADGMQCDEMWQVAADFDVPVVVPFLSGPTRGRWRWSSATRSRRSIEFFDARLAQADHTACAHRCILDPGTGFAPPNWPWEQRYLYQKQVYTNLDALRRFGLPLYVALPWKDTEQHDELLEIVVRQQPEYGRAHYPARCAPWSELGSLTDRSSTSVGGASRAGHVGAPAGGQARSSQPAGTARGRPRPAARARSGVRRSAGAARSARGRRW